MHPFLLLISRNPGGDQESVADRFLHGSATVVELAGVSIIILGALAATGVFIRNWAGSTAFTDAYTHYRRNLGRAILLGLEFLVAADIVGTVAVDPTFQNLGVLGLIVIIRTFLSFSLEVEIEGRWPWQQDGKPAGVKQG